MAAKSAKDYFGLGKLVSVILAIIPVTALILGVATRIKEKCYVAAILRIVLGWNIIWILDIVFVLLNGKILRVLSI
ncbi:MAG: hypothetical protein MJ248_04635 [Bacilli bacterium]|nr:hypothetical protein [Bacilli bacterium]